MDAGYTDSGYRGYWRNSCSPADFDAGCYPSGECQDAGQVCTDAGYVDAGYLGGFFFQFLRATSK
jgi:hypothetical protein